jgi:RNA polymerase subunit RPABC4/transcription elongation factor Spt4
MKIITFGLFIFSAYAVSNRIVPKKLCKDCKYFIAHKKECAAFGDTDFVNGEHDYNYAITARRNIDKCGEDAKYFEENTNKIITVPYYFILNIVKYWPLTPVFVLLFIYFDTVYKVFHQ